MMNMDEPNSGGEDFNMELAIENHMTVEDLGPGASEQDKSDLQALREDLRYWEESTYSGSLKKSNRWSQLPPRNKNVSCFHAKTMVQMYTTTPGAPQYKRMDKLVKGDKLWTR